MGLVTLLGRHIYFSASPAMHAAAFDVLGLPHRYELADVPAGDLPGAVAGLRNADSLGANVTTPHKKAVLGLLDDVEPLAVRAEAVNTIVSRKGRLLGYNTDIPAIVDELRLLPPTSRQAVVLGMGGAARAVSIALQMVDAVPVTHVTRSGAEGSVGWARLPELLRDADLLVNATPVGTLADESPVPATLLHDGLAVLDLVYRPSPTRLVGDARKLGAPARAGAGVLLGQAWRSLERWLGEPISGEVRAAMAAALRAELGLGADV
ncbi:shikimate dehydrogenase [soil metagenome]